jgi:hypothetical protein
MTSANSGMVDVSGGIFTVEDSTFADSSVSGLLLGGTGTASAIVRRSKFERNGFVGTARRGHGIRVIQARLVLEDSALWSNSIDGLSVTATDSYVSEPAEVSGSSIWGNRRFGVWIDTPHSAAIAPDGNVAGKPGNAVYDNGTFGLSSSETWEQIGTNVYSVSLDVDWRGTYWGPVSFVGCSAGSANGHLAYGVPDASASIAGYGVQRGPRRRRMMSLTTARFAVTTTCS